MEWTKTNTLKFIELWQRYPCLWNKKISAYKNRQKRRTAFLNLAHQMNVSGNAVEKKILSLKTQYKRELNKLKTKSRAGLDEITHSNWYAFEYLHFLKDVNGPQPRTNSLLALTEMGWYNPQKILGSLAVPEMRASTLAARALCLDPSYTKVPCVGGTEGESLVPLFSKAVEYFDFTRHNAEMLTETVRATSAAVSRNDGDCPKAADLSEAHALAGLVTKVANALLCKDVPRVTGFVQMNPGQIICSSRFMANTVEIQGSGIAKNLGLPMLSETETTLMNIALNDLSYKQKMVSDWYGKYCSSSSRLDACQLRFFTPKHFERFDDCAYTNM